MRRDNKSMKSESNEKEPNKTITVTKNGPYLVSGKINLQEQIITVDTKQVPIKWSKGTKYPTSKINALCRCGKSDNKPFCDGTHIRIKFDGTETADKETYLENPKKFEGPKLILTDYEKLCASARFCHRAGGIWNLVPNSNEKNNKKIAIQESCDCPSGRLLIFDKQANLLIEPTFEKEIGLIEDPYMGVKGPIWVRGKIVVVSAKGEPYNLRNRVTLCRCGKSDNKPFCDSSHYPEAETVESIHNK
jgi:CDGSH-type Zn-finger protein